MLFGVIQVICLRSNSSSGLQARVRAKMCEKIQDNFSLTAEFLDGMLCLFMDKMYIKWQNFFLTGILASLYKVSKNIGRNYAGRYSTLHQIFCFFKKLRVAILLFCKKYRAFHTNENADFCS